MADVKDLLNKKPNFGSIARTILLDNEGSTMTRSVDYKNSIPKAPARLTFKFRERVYTNEEAVIKHNEFFKEIVETPEMLDPTWFPKERSKDGDANGYYYVVKGYTLLEY